jgi:hypothetical protein
MVEHLAAPPRGAGYRKEIAAELMPNDLLKAKFRNAYQRRDNPPGGIRAASEPGNVTAPGGA